MLGVEVLLDVEEGAPILSLLGPPPVVVLVVDEVATFPAMYPSTLPPKELKDVE